MAYSNSNFDRKSANRLKEIVEYFQRNTKYNRPNIIKSSVNGSRYTLYYGYASKIYVSIDWNLPTLWTGESLEETKKNTYFQNRMNNTDAVIYPKKNYMVVNNPTILERGGNAFGINFHSKVNVVRHWGTPTLYAGTPHATNGPSCIELQYTEGKFWEDYMRGNKVIDRMPFYKGIKLDLDTAEVVNKRVPKADQLVWEQWTETTRLIRNSRARARNANNRALERLNKDRESGEYTNIEMDDAFRLFNVSDRREVIAHFGMDTILLSKESRVIDKDTIDGRKYELVQVAIEDVTMANRKRWCNYLRMINPSTGEIHFEGVPNIVEKTWQNKLENDFLIDKVTHALAWRDGDNLENYIKPVVLT